MSSLTTCAQLCARLAAVVLIATLGGCASFYVDMNLKELAPADRAVVAQPKPVQLLFEFQTDGVRNVKVSELLRPKVLEAVRGSGAFSEVSDGPVANGALVSITLNNVPLTSDAYAKGFVTGFTFGLVGNTVGDGYICTVDYRSSPNATKLVKTNRDAIYTSLGATSGPKQEVRKVKSLEEAGSVMAHKVVSNTINDLAKDPAFGKDTP